MQEASSMLSASFGRVWETDLFDLREEGPHAEPVVEVAVHVLAYEVAGALGLLPLLVWPHVRAWQAGQACPAGSRVHTFNQRSEPAPLYISGG